jgi:hypothetical protein
VGLNPPPKSKNSGLLKGDRGKFEVAARQRSIFKQNGVPVCVKKMRKNNIGPGAMWQPVDIQRLRVDRHGS